MFIFLFSHIRGVRGSFTEKEFQALAGDVDAFSLMTYDFSSFQNPGGYFIAAFKGIVMVLY